MVSTYSTHIALRDEKSDRALSLPTPAPHCLRKILTGSNIPFTAALALLLASTARPDLDLFDIPLVRVFSPSRTSSLNSFCSFDCQLFAPTNGIPPLAFSLAEISRTGHRCCTTRGTSLSQMPTGTGTGNQTMVETRSPTKVVTLAFCPI